MVVENKKNAAAKLESDLEKDETPLNSLNNMEEVEDDDVDEDEYEDEDEDEDEYDDEEEEEDEDEEIEEQEEEKANDGGNTNAVTVVNNEGTETKETAVKKERKKAEEPKSVKKTVEKNDTKEPESEKKSGETSKSKEKRIRKKNEGKDSGDVAVNRPESSNRKRPKRVASMGMVFMCSTKTKTDCFRYKILGLPESKKDQVLKIYRGMRLFLFDVDLRLMYGIFKAAGPGGYNIEPKAFKSEFPSQVRFSVLDDCIPLAEENFKSVLKENYYSRNKFEGLLKSDQVKNLCKLFVRSGGRSKSASRSRRARPAEPRRSRLDESRRNRHEDRKRRAQDEKRRPRPRSRSRSRSPLPREKRRLTDYDREPPIVYNREPPGVYDREPPVVYDHEPRVLYDREPPVSRYHPPPVASPVRLYAYERPPLDMPPYIREHVPEPHPYRVIDRDPVRDRDPARDRDPYLAYTREPYGREPPMYRDAVYTVPPEYHQVSREYHHSSAVQAPKYRVSGGSRVPSYRNVEIASDYHSSAMALPEYRSRTHYKY